MKTTKKMRKQANGMNAATEEHFKEGFKAPVLKDIAFPGNMPNFVKVRKGTPYVNIANFT